MVAVQGDCSAREIPNLISQPYLHVAISRTPHLYTHSHMQKPCDDQSLHYNLRYSSPSAAWVLIASIIVFFMVHQTQQLIYHR